MALCCVLQPGPASELVSMTIAGNFAPSHQRNGMQSCPKETEKQQLSSKPLALDPHEQVPLWALLRTPRYAFALKTVAITHVAMGLQEPPFRTWSLQILSRPRRPAKPRTVRRPAAKVAPWVPRQKRGRAPGHEPSCHSQDKRLSREKKI